MDFTLVTVAYADIFDYPLTHKELVRWMISSGISPKEHKEYYYLPGRSSLVAVRQERARWQQEKWNIARRAAGILSHIPTIQLVGVTGGLAMNNAKKDDDIDLFIITQRGYLWTTRLLTTILLFGMRRKRNHIRVKNKICLNMFMMEDALVLQEQDLFTAHEVLQMEPVFDRGHIYKRFLQANKWVKSYLPNAWRYRYGR